ncbi:hypothetical protein N7532_000989 [Penicillium argentinense]|uniref:Integral membrane protein n=1 Tax=Penicillium argentinense TaxID=1131581 RepID=A0A9W9G1K8_9EURO|nr:uncharacterized protein N7532_000989 [Penicillium argentinense]KAJ5110454.1 hypothetical protein N7532_000989 [Penicillium argentinense]
MATPADSSDTLITPPSATHPKQPPAMLDCEHELSSLDSPLPVPKLAREASDITWQESLESSKDQVLLVRRRGLFRLLHQQQFKNSLLASVGYLELANAGDFAANVWNEIPVPTFAAILMGIGGALALGMVFVAIQDFRLSWRNVRLLREEREHLTRLQRYHAKNVEITRLLGSRLGVLFRELGTEIVDRIVMDVLMGSGSILVGVGTLMAIGGADHHVYQASNLLSGYIGNALAALFGLANAIWSVYLIRRFTLHDAAVKAREPSDEIRRRLHTRFRRFQWHAAVNGLNGLVAGAASMVTAERWWGYCVLIPCIISLVLCNYFWRKKLGYGRPILDHASVARMQLTPLLEDLEYAIAMQRGLSEPENSLSQTIVQRDSLPSILQFIVRNRMLETYCDSLARDKKTRHILQQLPTSPADETIAITHDVLLQLSAKDLNSVAMLHHAQKFICKEGVTTFTHRERHLLELLGFAVWRDQTTAANAR